LTTRRSDYFLALDAGTSGGRAVIFDNAGRQLAEAGCAWTYDAPPDIAPWGREFDADHFWSLLCKATREAMRAADASPDRIAAVATTGQRLATVFLDEAGRELYAGPNLDLRAVLEGTRLLNEHGPRIYAVTGQLPPFLFASARWLWFAEHHPQVCEQTRAVLAINDWLAFRLSGEIASEPTNAAASGLFDVRARDWSDEMCQMAGLPAGVCRPLRRAGEVIGRVTARAAEQTGLAVGTPVVVAGADTSCGLLGMGVTQPGECGVVAGWSAPAQVVTAGPVFDPQAALWTSCHILPELWVLEGNAGPAGSAHRWACNVLFGNADWEAFDALAAGAPAGAGGALGFLGARIADYNDPRLLWGGWLMPLAGPLDGIGRAELARATFENVAFAVKANLERMGTLAPMSSPVRLGGGLARSQLLPQILADVLGRPVEAHPGHSVSALGAAMCAAAGVNFEGDVARAAFAMLRVESAQRLEPRRKAQAEYLDAFERWTRAYTGLAQLSEQL
jgi:autoinducer 2 (AI-2) kinase